VRRASVPLTIGWVATTAHAGASSVLEKVISPKFVCSGGGYDLAIVALKRQLLGYPTAP
jgi:hypothetical protein